MRSARWLCRGRSSGRCRNRLKVTDWIKRHPGVADERIESPMVVIGMFRAGTTFLTYLLEQDPAHRSPVPLGGRQLHSAARSRNGRRRSAHRRDAGDHGDDG